VSAADPATARRVVQQWGPLALNMAALHTLDHADILALICQESAGDPYAWRPEPGFAAHYRSGILASLDEVKDPAAAKRYRQWFDRDPLVLASSFGLMQILTICAIERGCLLRYPTQLCEPQTGLDAGCRHLRWIFNQIPKTESEPRRWAWLRWNGGGDPAYPDEIQAWQSAILAVLRETV
jgi:hypothetical protein